MGSYEADRHAIDTKMSTQQRELIHPRTRSIAGTEGRAAVTPTTAAETTSVDVSSFEKVLRAQLKDKMTEVPDYTLDYGYEGGSDEDGYTAEAASSLVQPETSSGFNDGGEPFGETFDALYELPDGEHYSRDNH
ncbi:hypothetical protein TSMEX_002670 [Taenia solium]|eukprot:TsM_000936700 transcript=TsM_000936700 gene=TsM_000936700